MDILSNLDLGVVLICAGLCCGGIILIFFLQLIGGFFGVFAGLFEIGLEFLAGGPVAWCGCLAAIVFLVICGLLTLSLVGIVSTCGTPDAVNFCELF